MPKISDPYSELASMFLTGGFAHDGVAAQAPPPPTDAGVICGTAPIELLIVGHLPVRGNLWLTPYADALAREVGSIALVRLDGSEPSIQLLRAPAALATAALADTMTQAIDELGPYVDQWIVRAPTGASPAALAAAAHHVDLITILTSADEAAVVAAYQIVKELAQSTDVPALSRLPHIGLAVVGSDPAAASATVDRLNRTTANFLGVDLQLTLCLPRMDAGVKSTRYVSFPGEVSLSLRNVMESIDRARARRAESPRDHAEIAGRLYPQPHPVEPRMNTDEHGWAGQQRVADHAVPVATAGGGSREQRVDIENVGSPAPETTCVHPCSSVVSKPPPIKLAPKPAMFVEGKEPARATEPADAAGRPLPLSGYVEGLKTLPVRAPGHEKIEIAVDGEGRLHLLGQETSFREMRIVERWTKDHRELLIMACPQHPIDSLATPRCHIFAERPIAVADLHGTDLCLHVLAPVNVNGATAWYVAPLNVAAV